MHEIKLKEALICWGCFFNSGYCWSDFFWEWSYYSCPLELSSSRISSPCWFWIKYTQSSLVHWGNVIVCRNNAQALLLLVLDSSECTYFGGFIWVISNSFTSTGKDTRFSGEFVRLFEFGERIMLSRTNEFDRFYVFL